MKLKKLQLPVRNESSQNTLWLSAGFTSVRPQLSGASRSVKKSRKRRHSGTHPETGESRQILLEFDPSVREKGLTADFKGWMGG